MFLCAGSLAQVDPAQSPLRRKDWVTPCLDLRNTSMHSVLAFDMHREKMCARYGRRTRTCLSYSAVPKPDCLRGPVPHLMHVGQNRHLESPGLDSLDSLDSVMVVVVHPRRAKAMHTYPPVHVPSSSSSATEASMRYGCRVHVYTSWASLVISTRFKTHNPVYREAVYPCMQHICICTHFGNLDSRLHC